MARFTSRARMILRIAGYVVAACIVYYIYGVYIFPRLHQKKSTTENPAPKKPSFSIVERKGRKFDSNIKVPEDKYPHGFPIEILDFSEEVKGGHWIFSGYCRWHPDVGPPVGGKIAVVPVVIYELRQEIKQVAVVEEVTTRETDGHFHIIVPYQESYALGLRIEKAVGCPERFKHSEEAKEPEKAEKKESI